MFCDPSPPTPIPLPEHRYYYYYYQRQILPRCRECVFLASPTTTLMELSGRKAAKYGHLVFLLTRFPLLSYDLMTDKK